MIQIIETPTKHNQLRVLTTFPVSTLRIKQHIQMDSIVVNVTMQSKITDRSIAEA